MEFIRCNACNKLQPIEANPVDTTLGDMLDVLCPECGSLLTQIKMEEEAENDASEANNLEYIDVEIENEQKS